MGDSLRDAIDRAIMVLTRERLGVIEGRKKFEPGGNLHTLIEQESNAAIAKVEQIDREIEELGRAIEYLQSGQ